MGQEKLLENWKTTKAGTVQIDWQQTEQAVGFELHENFKDLYSRILAGKGHKDALRGIMKFNPEVFVKEYISSKQGWLEDANGGRDFCEFTLELISKSDSDYICQFVKEAFSGAWTGGNDFGHRAYIGDISLNIGDISIIFNNDTGKFEWVDFSYGYFEVYEENPYGIIADTAQEFLDKFEGK